MNLEAFSIANRALRVKRRTFSKEITAALNDARSEFGLTKEAFNEKRVYLEHHWEEVVTSPEDCIHLVDDEEEQEEEKIEEVKDHLDVLKEKKNGFST